MGGNDSPVAYLTFSRHQQQRRGSSKRSGPLDDQPFSGLLRPENLSRELWEVFQEIKHKIEEGFMWKMYLS